MHDGYVQCGQERHCPVRSLWSRSHCPKTLILAFRVGRTARAGKTGQAFTLLLKVQERKFLQMVSEAGVPELACREVPRKLLQPLVARYETALSQLEKTVKEEQKLKAA